jgi:hypothetical protein
MFPDGADTLLQGILDELRGLRLDVGEFRLLVTSVADSQIKIASMLEQHGARIDAMEKTIAALPCRPTSICPSK